MEWFTNLLRHYPELLDFPAETLAVLISRKKIAGMTVDKLRRLPEMHGVSIKSIR